MKFKEIEVGDKFTNWTVVEFAYKLKSVPYYKVKCCCIDETVKIISRQHLIDKKSKSCGCLRLIKIGSIFGNWTVINDTGEIKKGGHVFEVQCSCDKKTIKKYEQCELIQGRTISCGCLTEWPSVTEECKKKLSEAQRKLIDAGTHHTANKRFTPLSKKYPEQYDKGTCWAASIMRIVKWGAKSRNLEFKLDKLEAFEKYCLGACFYCGITPNWPETHNGIDRIDNNKGYIEENCVSCCYQCNMAKNDYDISYFKQKIIKLYECLILNIKNEWIDNNIKFKQPDINKKFRNFKNRTDLAKKYPETYGLIGTSYAQKIYLKISNRFRKIKSYLNPIDVYEKYILGVCFYCGLKPQFPHTRSGIDRIDSKNDYIEDNCVACCKFCNQAKLDYTLDEFKEWIIRIYTHMTTVGWNLETNQSEINICQ